jgi:hypothetical protein
MPREMRERSSVVNRDDPDIEDRTPPPLRIALDPVAAHANHLPRDR